MAWGDAVRDDFLLVAYVRALRDFCLGIFTAASMLLGVQPRGDNYPRWAVFLGLVGLARLKKQESTSWNRRPGY
jgi:hypothetical protein